MVLPPGTIAAVATPPGRGGLGTLRISGPDAETIGAAVFRPVRVRDRPRHAQARFGTALDPEGSPLDRGFLLLLRAPRSFTGEDTVEITLHGSPYLLGRLLESAIQAGARPAEPGEFTYRAFRNGHLDLAEAEAVDDLIAARTAEQARVAYRQTQGGLARRLAGTRDALVDLVARLEAALEFSEEDGTTLSSQELRERLEALELPLRTIHDSFRRGRLLREGATVVLAGTPNVGKSSLFNRLVGEERAIVSSRPGTTRDLLSETVAVQGVPLRLQDTAGHGQPEDLVEREGVRRADDARRDADLVLLVLDGSRPLESGDRDLLRDAPPGTVVVVNKRDLTPAFDAGPLRDTDREVVELSARTGEGVDGLLEAIGRSFPEDSAAGDVPLTRVRQQQEIETCLAAVERARLGACEGLGEEILLAELGAAMRALGRLTGELDGEAIYDRIFSTFCIGK